MRTFEIEPKVFYLKWYLWLLDEEKEFEEEIKQEVSLNIQEQYPGGLKVY